jgi:hypothetical protein
LRVRAIALASGPLSAAHTCAPNPKLLGISAPTLLSPELRQSAVAEGAQHRENPKTGFEFYGFGSIF